MKRLYKGTLKSTAKSSFFYVSPRYKFGKVRRENEMMKVP